MHTVVIVTHYKRMGYVGSPEKLEQELRPEICEQGQTDICNENYSILDGYPASLGFPGMHRVHAICTLATIANT